MQTIQVNPPRQLSAYKFLYIKSSYKISPLKLLNVKDIIVTSDGLCFKDSEIIKECIQSFPDKMKIFKLEGSLQLKTKPIHQMGNDCTYLLIHHPWLNYYHWLTESIPRLWSVRKFLNEVVLLLPEHYKTIRFVQESLIPFKVSRIEYYPSHYNVRIKKALIPQIKPICSDYDPDLVCELRKFYVDYLKKQHFKMPLNSKRIYIIRGKSKRRRIVNESELQEILAKYDFLSINAESYSFFEQILFSDKARFLISNGSGLTNMHFMRDDTSVLELQKRITNPNDFHDRVLWHLASALNLNYFYFVCDPVNKQQDMYYADLKINLKKFEHTLNKMLK